MRTYLCGAFAAAVAAGALMSCSPSGGGLGGMPAESRDLITNAVRQAMQANPSELTDLSLDSQLMSALLYDDGVVRTAPNPDSVPWYGVQVTDAGQAYLQAVASGVVLDVGGVQFANSECWDDDEVRSCAADATIEIAPAAAVEPYFALGSAPALSTRVVLRRDPRVGAWQVADASSLSQVAGQHARSFFAGVVQQRAGAFAEQINQDRGAAITAAFDIIQQRLSSEFRRNDDGTVEVLQRRLQFSPNIVQSNSFGGIFDACEALTAAGHSDWRLPTRDEFLSIAVRDGQRWRVRDTPDLRFWGPRFSPGAQFVVNAMMTVGDWRDFPLQDLARNSGMIVAVYYRVQSDAAGGGLKDEMTYSRAGYYRMSNIRTPGSTMSALCVRNT